MKMKTQNFGIHPRPFKEGHPQLYVYVENSEKSQINQ